MLPDCQGVAAKVDLSVNSKFKTNFQLTNENSRRIRKVVEGMNDHVNHTRRRRLESKKQTNAVRLFKKKITKKAEKNKINKTKQNKIKTTTRQN